MEQAFHKQSWILQLSLSFTVNLYYLYTGDQYSKPGQPLICSQKIQIRPFKEQMKQADSCQP